MKQLPFQLSILVFLIALLSGFYMKLPLLDNLIRAFVIYLVFSVVELIVLLIYNQTMYTMLKSQLEEQKEEAAAAQEAAAVESQQSDNQ